MSTHTSTYLTYNNHTFTLLTTHYTTLYNSLHLTALGQPGFAPIATAAAANTMISALEPIGYEALTMLSFNPYPLMGK